MLRAACLLALAVLASAAHAGPTSGKVVLFPGDLPAGNYGGETGIFEQYGGWNIPGRHFKPGGGWWTLSCRAMHCALAQATLSIKPATHPQYDGPVLASQLLAWTPLPGQSKALPVQDAVIVAIFKPVALPSLALREGPVTTWYQHRLPEPPALGARQRLAMSTGHEAFLTQKLKQVRTADGSEEEVLHLGLEIDGVRQPLGTWQVHMENPGFVSRQSYVMWAGDLDGDGKLDLLLNTSAFYWRSTLYLSTLAKPGQLVGEAGSFEFAPPDASGC